MKLAALSLLVASAAAFAPAPAAKTSTALNIDATKEIGALTPLGFYDPLQLCTYDPTNCPDEEFEKLRYAELKHGRCAMLAVVGYLVTDAGIRFPGAENIPSGVAALGALPGIVWLQFFATVVLMETANGRMARVGKDFTGTAEFPGDFRNKFIDFGWDKQSDAWKANKRTIELNNGRAAQMGIFGLVTHDLMGNLSDILPGH